MQLQELLNDKIQKKVEVVPAKKAKPGEGGATSKGKAVQPKAGVAAKGSPRADQSKASPHPATKAGARRKEQPNIKLQQVESGARVPDRAQRPGGTQPEEAKKSEGHSDYVTNSSYYEQEGAEGSEDAGGEEEVAESDEEEEDEEEEDEASEE